MWFNFTVNNLTIGLVSQSFFGCVCMCLCAYSIYACTCAEVTREGQALLNHSNVNSISFSSHELLTHVIFGPLVATSGTDIEILYTISVAHSVKIHCKIGT